MSNPYTALVRNFEADPSSISSLPVIDPECELDDSLFWDTIHENRPELFALAALATDHTVTNAYLEWEQNQDTGLSYNDDLETSLDRLPYRVNNMITGAIDDGLNAMEASIPGSTERFRLLTGLFHQTFAGSRYESVEDLLKAGTGTAAAESANLLKAVIMVVEAEDQEFTNKDIAEIARNSDNLARKVASVNIDHLPGVSNLIDRALSTMYPDIEISDLMVLSTNKQGLKFVNFTGPLVKKPRSSLEGNRIEDKDTTFNTLGCPALVKFGETPTISKLWQWVIDIAEHDQLFVRQ